jgi:hypothetical protein
VPHTRHAYTSPGAIQRVLEPLRDASDVSYEVPSDAILACYPTDVTTHRTLNGVQAVSGARASNMPVQHYVQHENANTHQTQAQHLMLP